MINRLGWKADVFEDNSDCSVDSLTDADEAELDDFFHFYLWRVALLVIVYQM